LTSPAPSGNKDHSVSQCKGGLGLSVFVKGLIDNGKEDGMEKEDSEICEEMDDIDLLCEFFWGVGDDWDHSK
jgi:hypothetical protein